MQADYTLLREILRLRHERHPEWTRYSELCEQATSRKAPEVWSHILVLKDQGYSEIDD